MYTHTCMHEHTHTLILKVGPCAKNVRSTELETTLLKKQVLTLSPPTFFLIKFSQATMLPRGKPTDTQGDIMTLVDSRHFCLHVPHHKTFAKFF